MHEENRNPTVVKRKREREREREADKFRDCLSTTVCVTKDNVKVINKQTPTDAYIVRREGQS